VEEREEKGKNEKRRGRKGREREGRVDKENKYRGLIGHFILDDNNFYSAPADSHFSIPSPSRPDFRILPLDHGHFATSWKELLVGHNPEGVETWCITGWGRVVATSPDRSLIVATSGKGK
jgi:hypothetical protein